jgi:hypothetical protein
MTGGLMTMTACSRCQDLRTTLQIKNADDMTNVLKVIRDNLGDGTLVEAAYWPDGQVKVDRPNFTSIPTGGPWPDYFEYYFSCATCRQLYRLSVEAFHGIGGTWSPWDQRR